MGQSNLIWHDLWGGQTNGDGSWADFPFYGTENFWFIEDNTIIGAGTTTTSGNIDLMNGGRYCVRHNYFRNAKPGGHGTEGGLQRGARIGEIYDNTIEWTIHDGGTQHRAGTYLWHDNTWIGVENSTRSHSSASVFREIGAIGNDLSKWGLAGGENPWDVNDPHGMYQSGVSSASLAGGTLQVAGSPWTVNQWAGYSVTNTNPISACYLHSSYILSNTANTITYYFYASGDRGAPLLFNTNDTFEIYRVFVALDQLGQGKGDLIAGSPPLNTTCNCQAWPHSAQEPGFSWNNVHAPNGHAYGFENGGYPTVLANRDYYNLGSGFPIDSTPLAVSSFYAAAVNGVQYTGSYCYPHPLQGGTCGSPTPTPTPTPTPAPTPTPDPTATPSPTPTATGTPIATPTVTPTPTPKPGLTPTASPTATPTTPETQLRLYPALLRLSAMISQYSSAAPAGFC